jgi:hypothetical protein
MLRLACHYPQSKRDTSEEHHADDDPSYNVHRFAVVSAAPAVIVATLVIRLTGKEGWDAHFDVEGWCFLVGEDKIGGCWE